ncbi:MAG: DUF434 domain-containing protein [Candidatus Altiarchaeota archaeon]|nr:DUF434 domain-containing protein [Candidatus Altiarchaeota archaeon]
MPINKAAQDMKYLLNRGYPRSTALNLVVNHYCLSLGQRNFLVRYVFSDDETRDHKSRLIPVKEIMGGDVVVDTFNVLITVEAVLSGGEIVEGMDGFLRDTSAVFSKYRFSETSKKALNKLLEVLSRHKPASVLFILDSQISRSGELASFIRNKLGEFSLEGGARTSGRADYEIIKLNRITCTSDSVIIGKVDRVVDLGKEVLSSVACS